MNYETPEAALKDIFGYDEFRGSQKEIIEANLEGRDGLVLMATGGGKSLCFQIPGIMRTGTTVVVSPLIALMKDQVDNLRKKGVKAACFYHKQDEDEKHAYTQEVLRKESKFIYVSPERLANEDFYQMLRTLDIQSIAIDEAHCASMWGHDFRPEYRKVGGIIDRLGNDLGRRIQRFGYTATATTETREDIKQILDLKEDAFTYVGSFDRPNIAIEVRKANNKFEAARDIISQSDDEPTIIYCPTIKGVVALQKYLSSNGIEAGIYHGKLDTAEKKKAQEDFVNGKMKRIIATSAFGTGIDISNIRLVMHLGMPGNMEAYLQEKGRAGRDGKESRAVLIYHPNDTNIHHFFTNGNYPDQSVVDAVASVLRTFDQSAPINLKKDDIASLSALNLTGYEVDSALRIMSENEMLSTTSEIQSDDVGIEFRDMFKEIDFEYLNDRKRLSYDKLGAIQRFCETRTCRRTFMLDYMGENHRAGTNCGNCDNCNKTLNARKEFKEEFPGEAVVSALSMAKDSKGALTDTNMVRLLRGVENRAFARKGWNELPGYGALESWTTSKIQGLVAQLERSSLIAENRGKLNISEAGTKWLDRSSGAKKEALGNSAPEDNVNVDLKKKKFLQEWAVYKANELGGHQSAILSEGIIDRIAKDKRPITLEVLSDAGLTRAKIGLYGMQLIKDLKVQERQVEAQAPTMAF